MIISNEWLKPKITKCLTSLLNSIAPTQIYNMGINTFINLVYINFFFLSSNSHCWFKTFVSIHFHNSCIDLRFLSNLKEDILKCEWTDYRKEVKKDIYNISSSFDIFWNRIQLLATIRSSTMRKHIQDSKLLKGLDIKSGEKSNKTTTKRLFSNNTIY